MLFTELKGRSGFRFYRGSVKRVDRGGGGGVLIEQAAEALLRKDTKHEGEMITVVTALAAQVVIV